MACGLFLLSSKWCYPFVGKKVGKQFRNLSGISKLCSSQNYLQVDGALYALRSFLGSRHSMKSLCQLSPCGRAEEGDGEQSSIARVLHLLRQVAVLSLQRLCCKAAAGTPVLNMIHGLLVVSDFTGLNLFPVVK